MYISCHVVFHENIFSLVHNSSLKSTDDIFFDKILSRVVHDLVDFASPQPSQSPFVDYSDYPTIESSHVSIDPCRIHSQWISHPLGYLNDYYCYYVAALDSTTTNHPLFHYLSNAKLSHAHKLFALPISSQIGPTTYHVIVQYAF